MANERMIHRYWGGPNPPPPFSHFSFNALASLNPNHYLMDWTDETLPPDILEMCATLQYQVHPADYWRHRANIIRLALLNTFGGWWYDHDVIPLLPVDALPYPVAAAHGSLCNSFLGYPAASSELSMVLSEIVGRNVIGGRSVDVSGEVFLDSRLTCQRLNYPLDSHGQALPCETVFAVHLYNSKLDEVHE